MRTTFGCYIVTIKPCGGGFCSFTKSINNDRYILHYSLVIGKWRVILHAWLEKDYRSSGMHIVSI